jgi:hypothetical protein
MNRDHARAISPCNIQESGKAYADRDLQVAANRTRSNFSVRSAGKGLTLFDDAAAGSSKTY